MIEIKSAFGNWQTVTIEKARGYVETLISRGANVRGIEFFHLRGISVAELIQPKSYLVPWHLSRPKSGKPAHEPKPEKDYTFPSVEMELLARKQASMRFKSNILFSLMVWQCDKSVQEKLPPVAEWLRECRVEIDEMLDNANGEKGDSKNGL